MPAAPAEPWVSEECPQLDLKPEPSSHPKEVETPDKPVQPNISEEYPQPVEKPKLLSHSKDLKLSEEPIPDDCLCEPSIENILQVENFIV